MINKILSTIFINALILYLISRYIPQLGFSIQSEFCISMELFLLIGLIFWAINDITRNVLKLLTLPIRIITLGLFGIVLNVLMFYIFKAVINGLDIGLTIILGNVLQIIIMSIIISFMNLLFKKL